MQWLQLRARQSGIKGRDHESVTASTFALLRMCVIALMTECNRNAGSRCQRISTAGVYSHSLLSFHTQHVTFTMLQNATKFCVTIQSPWIDNAVIRVCICQIVFVHCFLPDCKRHRHFDFMPYHLHDRRPNAALLHCAVERPFCMCQLLHLWKFLLNP